MKSIDIRFDSTLEKVPPDSENVLDLGCVRHNKKKRERGNLHDRLTEHVEGNVVGIDINKREIKKMQKSGYDVRVGDAEELDFDQRFEVVVAGEVIEHLHNPGKFLERAGSILVNDGRLVLSTPNPDGFAYFRKALLGQENNPTHTCWIDPFNLEVLVKKVNDLTLSSYEYLPPVGGVSMVLWKLGYKRAGSPGYVAVLEKEV